MKRSIRVKSTNIITKITTFLLAAAILTTVAFADYWNVETEGNINITVVDGVQMVSSDVSEARADDNPIITGSNTEAKITAEGQTGDIEFTLEDADVGQIEITGGKEAKENDVIINVEGDNSVNEDQSNPWGIVSCANVTIISDDTENSISIGGGTDTAFRSYANKNSIENVTVEIESDNRGIWACGDSSGQSVFTIKDADVTIRASDMGIKSVGGINIINSNVDAWAGWSAIYAQTVGIGRGFTYINLEDVEVISPETAEITTVMFNNGTEYTFFTDDPNRSYPDGVSLNDAGCGHIIIRATNRKQQTSAAPLYRVTDLNEKDIAYEKDLTDGKLTIKTIEDDAKFIITKANLIYLLASGVETIELNTPNGIAGFDLADVAESFKELSGRLVMTVENGTASLTLGGEDYSTLLN